MKLSEILNERHDDQDAVERYAKELGVGEVWWEGSGDMGTAYTTEKNTIIKITSDETELEHARLLVGLKLDNVVNIYAVKDSMIHMEMLDMGDAEEMFSRAQEFSEDGIEYVDVDEVPPDVAKFVNDISYGMYELRKHGVNNLDLKHDNIGMRGDDYVIFDTSSAKGQGFFQ